MCDCYEIKCEGCECKISIHVGDFSVARSHVKAWCPKCLPAFHEHIAGPRSWRHGPMMVWTDVITDSDEWKGCEKGVVVFAVPLPRQIHVN